MESMKRAEDQTDPDTSQSTTIRPLRGGLRRNRNPIGIPWVREAARRVRLTSRIPRDRAAYRRRTISRSLRTSWAITSRRRTSSPGDRLANGCRPKAP